ncbi:MAG: phosphoglucosamine mutase [Planctomycetes bacterium]|nr:phosphoglucosamine mutase [Planctomycetota bacterium]
MSHPENIFGTDGVRDRAGEGLLSDASIERFGLALASFVREGVDYIIRTPRVLIGRDTRVSGPRIEALLSESLGRRHATVESAGILPTPAISLLVDKLGYDLGVVISASHNPPEFNGLKVFDRRGRKLDVGSEQRITALYHRVPDFSERRSTAISFQPDLPRRYLDFLAQAPTIDLRGLTVVLDCACGATAPVAVQAFERAGARVIAIHTDLDGERINVDCGSLNPEAVGEVVKREGADLGVAFDGDGDRAILVDEKGEVVDGDEVMALWALDLHGRGALRRELLVTTVMSNAGMESYLRDQGISLIRTGVGDREVYQAMELNDAVLGGEQSGHIIDRQYASTGDGIRTGLAIARLLHDRGEPLSKLRAPIPRFPQVLLGVEVEHKVDFEELERVTSQIRRVEEALEGRGRLLLRYSGTEPLARILVEGPDPEENRDLAESLAELLRNEPRLH